MILINLLPEEYRQSQRTPLKYFAGVALAVAVNASLLAYWGWTAFGIAAEVESDLTIQKDTFGGLEGQVKYHENLEKESNVYRNRETTLATVTGGRVSWTQQVDDLIDLINRGGDGSRYLIWLDDLVVDQKPNQRRQSFGQMKSSGRLGSDSFADVANFFEDIQQSRLSDTFMTTEPPAASQSNKDEELVPSQVWSFDMDLIA